MKMEMLVEVIIQGLSGLARSPGEGLIVFVKCGSDALLRKLALRIAEAHPSGPVPIYMVSGGIGGVHGWPFSRIRKGPRIRIDSLEQVVTETGGVIFPEDRPIILLAENFDLFAAKDQRAYCHLVDGEGQHDSVKISLCQGSILLGGITGKGEIEPGSSRRGMVFELEDTGD